MMTQWLRSERKAALLGSDVLVWVTAVLVISSLGLVTKAQAFESGSTGTDGALELTTPGTFLFWSKFSVPRCTFVGPPLGT